MNLHGKREVEGIFFSKIVLHAFNNYETPRKDQLIPVNITIRVSDCDVLIIMLDNMHRMLQKDNTIWMDTSTGKNRRLENVTNMYKTLRHKTCQASPVYTH